MAKVSTTLKNIENNQEEEKQLKRKKEEEKQLKKEYDEILKTSINNVISFTFEDFDNIDDAFNDLVLNDIIYKQKIERIILSEQVKKYNWKKVKNNPTYAEFWEDSEDFEAKFKNLYNIDDIEKLYIPTLKKIYNNYILKQKVSKKELEKSLLNYFNTLKNENSADNVVKVVQKEHIKQSFCQEIAKDLTDYNYLYENYNNILHKWYNQNKPIIKEKEVKQPKKSKKSSGLIGGLVGWWLGGKL